MSTTMIDKTAKADVAARRRKAASRSSTDRAQAPPPQDKARASGQQQRRAKPSARQATPVAGRRQRTPQETERMRRQQRAQLQQSPRSKVPTSQPTAAPRDEEEWRFSVELAFVYASYFVSAALVLLFGFDLLTGIPFKRASVLFDVTNVICGLALGYLSWNTHRDWR